MISGLVKTTWASLGEVNRMSISRSPVATFWLLKLDIGHRKISTDRKLTILHFVQIYYFPLRFNACLLTNLRTIINGGNLVIL